MLSCILCTFAANMSLSAVVGTSLGHSKENKRFLQRSREKIAKQQNLRGDRKGNGYFPGQAALAPGAALS